MAQILLVDDEKVARQMYTDFLLGAGHHVTAVGTLTAARDALSAGKFDLLVTDLLLPDGDGLSLLQFSKAVAPLTEVIVITALDKVDPAVRAIKNGASDYLLKPVGPDVLSHAVTRALTTRALLKENKALRRHLSLMETGQRIATTLDRERLAQTACASFASTCQTNAAAIVMRSDAGLTVEGAFGLSEAQRESFAAALAPTLAAWVNAPPASGAALGALDGFTHVHAVPATDNGRFLGAMVLLHTAALTEADQESAAVLASHLGLALRNLGRFSEVEDLIYLDELTHLFNSRYLESALGREFKRAADGDLLTFSLLFLDLDHFKNVNDTHGHLVGSKLLVETGRVLKGCVRDNDVCCRWGGDEFVVLLRNTDSGGALKVAERIRRSVETHHFLAREGYSIALTTCIGVASYPEHAQDQTALLDFADRAMYRGKKGHRNIIYLAQKDLEPTPPHRHEREKAP